jgi:prepilin-type processing-associated H-X9-DG protein
MSDNRPHTEFPEQAGYTPSPDGHKTTLAGLIVAVVMVGLVVLLCAVVFGQDSQRSREAAWKSSCQSNMKELATAFLLYLGDYDSTLPSSYLYGRSKTWNKEHFKAFASRRGMIPTRPFIAGNFSWPMLLYTHMKNKDIMWCPSDTSVKNDPAARVSYYWKAAIDAAWYGGPDGKGPICRRLGDLDYPADQIILYERVGWHSGDADKGLVDGVTINVAWVDGHVSSKRISSSGYTPDEVPAEPLPKSGVGEPAWYNFDFENSGEYSWGSRSNLSTAQLWNPHIYGDSLP